MFANNGETSNPRTKPKQPHNPALMEQGKARGRLKQNIHPLAEILPFTSWAKEEMGVSKEKNQNFPQIT